MRIRSIGRYLDRIAGWSPTCARDNHVVDVSADEYRNLLHQILMSAPRPAVESFTDTNEASLDRARRRREIIL